jgi:hypothetical protein
MKTCQWCDDAFEAKVNYQIYCSAGCREEATKEKIAERYAQSRRAKMMKKQRFCTSCEKRLSAYNDDPICQACMVDPKEVSRALREIRGIANDKDR